MARKPPVLLALLALLLVAPATARAATVLAVSLVQDRRVEGPEQFTVTLPVDYAKPDPALRRTATVTVLDSDLVAPRVDLLVAGLTRPAPTLRPVVRCNEACSGRLELRLSGRRLAAARVSLSAAGRNAVPLRLDAAGLRHLRRTRRVRIVLRAVLADAAGNRRIATRAVTLAR